MQISLSCDRDSGSERVGWWPWNLHCPHHPADSFAGVCEPHFQKQHLGACFLADFENKDSRGCSIGGHNGILKWDGFFSAA